MLHYITVQVYDGITRHTQFGIFKLITRDNSSYAVNWLRMLAQRYQKLAFPDLHGSGVTAFEPASIYSDQKHTDGRCFHAAWTVSKSAH